MSHKVTVTVRTSAADHAALNITMCLQPAVRFVAVLYRPHIAPNHHSHVPLRVHTWQGGPPVITSTSPGSGMVLSAIMASMKRRMGVMAPRVCSSAWCSQRHTSLLKGQRMDGRMIDRHGRQAGQGWVSRVSLCVLIFLPSTVINTRGRKAMQGPCNFLPPPFLPASKQTLCALPNRLTPAASHQTPTSTQSQRALLRSASCCCLSRSAVHSRAPARHAPPPPVLLACVTANEQHS